MTKFSFNIFPILLLFVSCREAKRPAVSILSNDDVFFALMKKIDSLNHLPVVMEADYSRLYVLTDSIKPVCDRFRGADRSHLPGMYNTTAYMLWRRCVVVNGLPGNNNCFNNDTIIDCCLRAIPISRSMGDTLSLNYTNSLHLLAGAYEATGEIDEALNILLEFLDKYRKMFSEMSAMTAGAYFEVGSFYERRRNVKKASEYYKKVLRLQKLMESRLLYRELDSIRAFQNKYRMQLK